MLSRWRDSAFFHSELETLANTANWHPDRVARIFEGNNYWQGLLHWVSEQRQAKDSGTARVRRGAAAPLTISEDWLEQALKRLRVRQTFDALWNHSAIGQYPSAMVAAARRAVSRDPSGAFRRNREGAASPLAAWEWECECSFVEPAQSLVRTPVALTYSQDSEGVSGLAWLELEVLDGDGPTDLHPGDVWSTILIDDPNSPEISFRDAMSSAFRCARELACVDRPGRGRWRIVDDKGVPLSHIGGDSAGGAALLAWYRAITGGVVDPRVLVMAAVREPASQGTTWSLAPVGGIARKAQAAIDAKAGIDTIAVVEGQFKQLKTALARQQEIRPEKLASDLHPRPAASRPTS
jgi:hypothetical protein